jgi:hypothetical protein
MSIVVSVVSTAIAVSSLLAPGRVRRTAGTAAALQPAAS